MGQAKARGTFEERKVQSILRRQAEDARRSEEHRQLMLRQREQAAERQKLLSAEEHKEQVLLVGDGGHRVTAAMLALALGASAPLLVVADRNGDGDSRG